MKKLFLLAIILISLSARAQTDTLKNSKTDSLKLKESQDSLLIKLLNTDGLKLDQVHDSLKIKQSQDSARAKQVQDSLANKKAQEESLRLQQIQDSLRLKKSQDSIRSLQVIPPDTLKSKDYPKDTLKTSAQPIDTLRQKDTLKTAVLTLDSLKPKEVSKDTLKTALQPVDSIKPKTTMDSLAAKPAPPDTLKPKPLIPDSLIRLQSLDSLSYDQILQYYVNEPEPIDFYKGPTVGDSVYYVLNPLTIPTNTVYGEPLSHHGFRFNENEFEGDSAFQAEQRLKPKISLGAGRLGFSGDLYKKHFQSPFTARPAVDLTISQRMMRYLQLDFNVLFGKLGANERQGNRNENFQSEIRAGGVNLLYDFGNFIPDKYTVRPFVSFGAYGFEFLSKTDIKDKNGNTYFYWSDGSIKDRAEGSADAQFANELVRDYTYESDIRELNRDGFGKYQERAWAFPVGAGVIMKITDRIDMKLNLQYYFSTTDYIDGISHKSEGERAGTRKKDNFTYMSFALQYDLIAKYKSKTKKYQDTLSKDFWLAFDNDDMDQDSVPDMQDDCQGTPVGAKVDARGCPVDEDNDGVPNYRDDELTTLAGNPVNARGVSQNDAYWQAWYDQYMNDSIASDRTTEYTGNIYAATVKKPKEKKENYTVELVRYTGSIPSDELAFLLSIGDINSTTLEDGTTVVYTSGSYDKLSAAIKRRDEFRTEGNKGAGISRIQGKEIVQVPADELEKLLQSEIEDLLNLNITDSLGVATSSNSNVVNDENSFSKEDIVYRVQLGAFKNKISTSVFNTSAGVLELKTGENIYRYVTKGYKSIEDAAAVRADLVVQGYSDAFVTAYKGGKRIPMNQTKATMDASYQEDLSEDKTFNSIDKKLLAFKVQLGPLKKKNQEAMMDEKVKDLGEIEKQTTSSGSLRYTAGNFTRLDAAEKYRKELEDKGYADAFVVATFRNEIISIQEAMELLK